jgi:phospholipase D1/2
VKRRGPNWKKLGIYMAIAVALAAAWRFTPLKEVLTSGNLREWARLVRETAWAPFALVLAYTPAALLLFPRPVLTLVAILAFGIALGMACAVAGMMVAALATYYAGRFISRDRLKRLAGEGFEPASKVLRRHGVIAMFALNQVPVPPFAVQGMLAGAARVNVWHYALGSLLGMAPGVLAWTLFGREVRATLEGSQSISWWQVAMIVVVLAVFTVLVRRWFARETTDQAARDT